MRDTFEFFKQFRERFETTGAVAPSSRFLAGAMTRPLKQRPDRPLRVLEVGPGTGAVTNSVVKLLGPDDRFDLVELNESFAGILERRFASDPAWKPAQAQSKVHVCPIQEFRPDGEYDFIISGLPFNNFPAPLVEDILSTCLKLLRPDGVLSMFEYMYVRPVRGLVSRGDEKARIRKIEDFLQGTFDQHRIRRDWVFANIPPAWVQHLKAPQPASQADGPVPGSAPGDC